MSELICPIDDTRYFDEGELGTTCPCCYGRALLEETEEDRDFWRQFEGWDDEQV